MQRNTILTAAAATLALPLSAATANDQNHIWSENAGFIRVRNLDQNDNRVPRSQFVRRFPNHIDGYAWAENLGWINFGPYLNNPGGQHPSPANQTGSNFGVNIGPEEPSGDRPLAGFAWSENAGWINFGPFPNLTGPNNEDARPRLTTSGLTGYAWAENLGWINLAPNAATAQIRFAGDLNEDESTDVFDLITFLQRFDPANDDTTIDMNQDLEIDVFDLIAFLQIFSISV